MGKKKPPPFVDHFMEYLEPHGPITARAMFGGYGIFYRGVIFAIIIEDMLYFRIDDKARIEFEEMGSEQFVYEGMRRPVGMPYFTLPSSILKNPKELKKWIERSYEISIKSKKPKRVKK